MTNYLIGLIVNVTWLAVALYFLLRHYHREHLARMAEIEARSRADREVWERKQAAWAEEDRRWEAEQAERERVWAEQDEELRQLQAARTGAEARGESEPRRAG